MGNVRSRECLEILDICQKYGYGNVMEWCSALWRFNAYKNGYPEEGCFVPTCPSMVKKKYRCPEQHALYDELVKEILGKK